MAVLSAGFDLAFFVAFLIAIVILILTILVRQEIHPDYADENVHEETAIEMV
jgi:hypothetical protein